MQPLCLFGKPVQVGTLQNHYSTTWSKENGEETDDFSFKEELERFAHLCGFKVVRQKRSVYKNHFTVLYVCQKWRIYDDSGTKRRVSGQRKAPKRERPAQPRTSARAPDTSQRCQWLLQLRFDTQANCVSVDRYSGNVHLHSLFDPGLVPSIVPDSTRERMLELWRLGALSSTQIALLLEQDLQSLTGDPAVILKKYVESFCRSSGENLTCAPALKAIVDATRHHVLWAMDNNGCELVLSNIDAAKLTEISPKISKDETRALRSESRQSGHMFDSDMLARAADNAVLLHRAKNAAVRQNPKLLNSVVSSSSTVDTPRGRGNHGAILPTDWIRFMYDGVSYTLLAVVWVTAAAHQDALRWGRVLICDDGYCVNKNRLPCFNGVTQDGNNRTVQFLKGFVNEREVSNICVYISAGHSEALPSRMVRPRFIVCC